MVWLSETDGAGLGGWVEAAFKGPCAGRSGQFSTRCATVLGHSCQAQTVRVRPARVAEEVVQGAEKARVTVVEEVTATRPATPRGRVQKRLASATASGMMNLV